VSNSGAGSIGILNQSGCTLDNSGELTVSSAGGNNIAIGISNSGTITNTISGTLLLINITNSTGIENNSGTITNSGELNVSNSGESNGIFNVAAIENSSLGTLNVTIASVFPIGIHNSGDSTLTNDGEMNVSLSVSDNFGIVNSDQALLTNNGTLNVTDNSDEDSAGILNLDFSELVNNSTLNVNNNSTGDTGIYNWDFSDLVNNGTLNLNNHARDGILNINSSEFTNTGTLNVNNNGDSTGIRNTDDSILSNSGSITVSNSGVDSAGIENQSDSTFINSGTVIVSNVGGVGIYNSSPSVINNSGSLIEIVAGATLDNYGSLNNGDTGIINVYGFFNNNPTTGEVFNDGHITIFAGGEIDNLDTIDNNTGEILKRCGGTYNGTAPIGNAIVNEVCDTTPPDTQITGAFDGKGNKLSGKGKNIPTTTSRSATFFFIGSDDIGISKYECNLDGLGWEDCTSPKSTPTNLQVAIKHVFKVRAVDLAGNADPTPAEFTWKINPPKLR